MNRKLAQKTILQLFESFSDRWNRDCDASTTESRRYALRRWERFSVNPAIARVTTETVLKFRSGALAAGLGEETAEHTISAVYLVLREAVRRKVIDAIPERPRRIRGALRRRKPPCLDEFDRFALTAIQMEEHGELPCPRQTNWFRTFLAVGYFTALRRSDLLERLTFSDIGADAITIRAKKTGKVQTIPVHPLLAAVLGEYRPWATGELVFPVSPVTVDRAFQRVQKVSGIRGVSPQTLRKISARAYERAHSGAGALILGHTLQGATAFYLDVPEILRMASDKLAVPGSFYEGLENGRKTEVVSATVAESIQRAALSEAISNLPAETVQALLKMCSASRAGGLAGK